MAKKYTILSAETANTLSRAEIDARVQELGELAGAGGDALPTLGLEVSSWAEQNKISPKKPTDAERQAGAVDDIESIFNHYANAQSSKSVNERSTASNTNTAQYSKLRQFAVHGATGRGGTDWLVKVQTRRNEVCRSKTFKCKPAYDAMLSAIRASKAGKAALTADEIDAAIQVSVQKPKTLFDLWDAIREAASEMVKENKDTGVDATNTLAIAEKRCSELEEGKKIAKWLSKAPAGITNLGGIGNFGIPEKASEAVAE